MTSQYPKESIKLIKISRGKTGLFTLDVQSNDTEVALKGVTEALSGATQIYEQSQLSSEREIIKILDFPQCRKKHVKPKEVKSIILGAVFGGMIGILIDLIRGERRPRPSFRKK